MTYQDDFEEHFLVDLHEFLVPLINVRSLLTGVGLVLVRGWWIVLVVSTPFNDLLENGRIDVRNWDSFGNTLLSKIANHVFDQD